MAQKFEEMGAQEIVDLLKSSGLGETAQVELIKAFAVTKQGAKMDGTDTLPDEIHARQGFGDLPNKGQEGCDDDEEMDPRKRKMMDDEDAEDGGNDEEMERGMEGADDNFDASTSKWLGHKKSTEKSYSRALEAHEDSYAYDAYKKSGLGASDLRELVDSTPILKGMVDTYSERYAEVAGAIDALVGEVRKSRTEAATIAKSQSARIASLEKELKGVKSELGKSRTPDAEPLEKSQPAATAMTGALVTTGTPVAKSVAANGITLTGNFNRDQIAVQTILEKAAPTDPKALKMLLKLNSIHESELPGIAASIPASWVA